MNQSKALTCDAVKKSQNDINNALQEKILTRLIEDVNDHLNDAVIGNRKSYTATVPSVVFGFPTYSVENVVQRLKETYEQNGFSVSAYKNQITIKW